jgi:putative spermidine/putrescine transport system ATP-binding protein
VIDQAASANDIFNSPKTPYVARFMGGQNVLTGTVESSKGRVVRLKANDGTIFEAPAGDVAAKAGAPLSFAIRRDRIKLQKQTARTKAGVNELAAKVRSTEYQGSFVKVTLEAGSEAFVANVSDSDYFKEPVDRGDAVIASWASADVHTLSKVDQGTKGDLDSSH